MEDNNMYFNQNQDNAYNSYPNNANTNNVYNDGSYTDISMGAQSVNAFNTYDEASVSTSDYYAAEANAAEAASIVNKVNICALVAGIISIAMCQFGLPLGITAIVLANVTKTKGQKMDSKAKAGMICGIIGICLILAFFILYFAIYGFAAIVVILDSL